jgi:hypothetical protein
VETTIEIEIAGLGIIFYSPFAVAHIKKDEEYIEAHFWEPPDVAAHVNACTISAFGTGSPGTYLLRLYDNELDVQAFESAKAGVRLGIEIRDRTLCFRDLYDFIRWDPECPAGQIVSVPDGYYRITAYTTPVVGSRGDRQDVGLHFEACPERPRLAWTGVPDLSGDAPQRSVWIRVIRAIRGS